MPLSKSSVSLKTDTSSKLYKSVWTSSDNTVIKVSGTTYFSTKVTHPDFKDGAKVVTLTLSIYDKKDTTKIWAAEIMCFMFSRNFLLIHLP
ncbi:MAG: hypothetical protein PUE60_03830 [Eubacteriales bacterium]|nr:hypothetical protein [Eubacteriales bacterium]